MRIAQIIDSLYVGGAEKLQVTFMRAALARGLQPTLIVFNFFADKPFYRELKEMGADMIEIKGRSLFDPTLLWRLFRFLRAQKFDLIHTHLTYGIILGGLAGRLAGIPVVASIHNLKPDAWAFLESAALRFFTDRRIAVGDTVAQAHQTGFYKYPIDVVINPVAATPVLSAEKKLEIRAAVMPDPSRTLLITVGRLIEAKGYNDLLDAVDELRRTHPQVFLAIVGIGDFLPQIRARVESLKLEDHVRLLGARGDVAELLSASDIYVSASHWEGLPVSILEAMSAGLPIVATRVGDIPRVVKPEFGICVPAHQPSAIIAALRPLIDDANQRAAFGAAARAYVAQHHTPDQWLDQILDIYDQVVPAGKKDQRSTHG